MDAAVDRISKSCVYVLTNATTTTTTTDSQFDTEFAMEFGAGTSLALDTQEIDSMTKSCLDEIPNTRRYIIWPRDGNDVAALRVQLLALDPATDEHVSVNEWGTMYFVSQLTMLGALRVTVNKQVFASS